MQGDEPRPRTEAALTSRRQLIAWAFYDWAGSAYVTIIQTFVFAAYFTRQVAEDETTGTSQWGYALGAAGLVVAISGPILGAAVDRMGRRKPWILAFTLLCVAATALLWFVRPAPEYVWLALVLVGVASIGEELAVVFYNSLLPTLVPYARLGRWSGWGWSLGYAGGLLSLLAVLLLFVLEDAWLALDRDSAEHLRAAFVVAALWYLLFALPLFLFGADTAASGTSLRTAIAQGLTQLVDTLRRVRRYGDILRFLIARIFYTDGLGTLFAFGGVFAAGTFGMGATEVLLFGIALNVTAGLGALLFSWVDDLIGSKWTILLSLGNLIVWGSLVLTARNETSFWLLGLLLGIFVGPVQAASRSYLARTAPVQLRSQMFGLFALSGKATSFMGPLLVGWVTALSGNQRIGMSVIIGYFLIGALIMFTVPAAHRPSNSA